MKLFRSKRLVHSVVLCLALTMFGGCYGPNNLSGRLHAWNGQVGGEWVVEGVFLGLFIRVNGFRLESRILDVVGAGGQWCSTARWSSSS